MLMTMTGFTGSMQLVECDVLIPTGQALRSHLWHRWQSNPVRTS